MPQNDEREIRTLMTDWAAAVHRGQMDRVLADHADDIVMFDVPPRARTPRTRRNKHLSIPSGPTGCASSMVPTGDGRAGNRAATASARGGA